MNVERVIFYSEGFRLVGNLHKPHKRAPCIIGLHGLESDKDGGKWPVMAEAFCKAGFAFLRFNFRGCGHDSEKSEGNFEDTCLTTRIADYRAAVKFLAENGGIDLDRIGAVGSSFGGMIAIAAQEKTVKALTTLAAPYTMPAISRVNGEYLILPSGNRLKKSFYEDLSRYDLLEVISRAPPILIIHGSHDQIVPVEHALRLYEHTPALKKLEIVAGADHVFSKQEHLNRVINLSVEWFKKCLR
ncbi:MAG: alpha/beta fold hydrolase [Candidatus Bathyarchaeia archaeon]